MAIELKNILNRLSAGDILEKEEARGVLAGIAGGGTDPSQVAAFLASYNMRPVTGPELSGFREAMIDLAVKVDLGTLETVDVCGTGGDGKDTFNISTASAFVIAGAGYKVAKHGNYSVSSQCGSSNVLEFLGYKMSADPDKLKRELDEAGFCYMHAPLFHPAMKEVAPVRRALGVKTFFNILGPLLNPSLPKYQLTGVFSASVIPLYKAVFDDIGITYAILHSLDGYDEISLTGPFRVATRLDDRQWHPSDLGMETAAPRALFGGSTVEEAAGILTALLAGNGTAAQRDAVCANAAFAIRCIDLSKPIARCIDLARESLVGGKAKAVLDKVIRLNQ